ncbi:MAG: starvation/stationary phase protection protein [Alphaproteobacteria bacterium]|jgi:starvation-inducible DNA-binding protein|nr:starvation/stationary phase protection protein [Alphaproteobacteria bacterium]
MIMDIGLQKKDRKVITDALSRVLADTFMLYAKTHGFHWNVTGPHFYSLHNLFKELYEDLIEGGDTLAERIRALGYWAPGSFAEFSGLSAVKEETHHIYDASDMLRQLVLDNELIVRRLKEVFDVAEANSDTVTADMITMRMEAHSKAAWMLRSHLE